jgi:hypothetical protein
MRPISGRDEGVDRGVRCSVGFEQPVVLQPVVLGLQGLAAATEVAEDRAADRLKVGQPAALLIRLDPLARVIVGRPSTARSMSSL